MFINQMMLIAVQNVNSVINRQPHSDTGDNHGREVERKAESCNRTHSDENGQRASNHAGHSKARVELENQNDKDEDESQNDSGELRVQNITRQLTEKYRVAGKDRRRQILRIDKAHLLFNFIDHIF